MDKKKALEKLRQQMSLIDGLRVERYDSPRFNKWRRDTEVAIEKCFGADTRHINDFNSVSYLSYGSPLGWGNSEADMRKDFLEGLESARAILQSLCEEIEDYGIGSFASNNDSPEPIELVKLLCNRFHSVARQIRSRYNNRQTIDVDDEYDVQDFFHSLLTIYFDDIRKEEWTPSYAGSCSRVDFLLKQEELVVEIKKTRKGLGARELGEQLIIDIQKYQAHPSCKTLVCFVYDPEERIANPRGIENDLSKNNDGLTVHVIITPR